MSKSIKSLSKEKIILDFRLIILYNTNMSKEITTRMSPEGLEVANSYLANGDVSSVCRDLGVPRDEVVHRYIDTEIHRHRIHGFRISQSF